MKAIVYSEFGNETVLRQGEVAAPALAGNEVRIAISHTSVNPVDWKIREGYLKEMFPHIFPIVPGWDAAGTVVEIGAQAKQFKVGDKVFAYTRLPNVQHGTYAESIALPETAVALIPNTLSEAQAAAVPLTGLTAFQALREIAGLKKGDNVFISGGAGGVGSFAVQFAKLLGANKVVTTASKGNFDYLQSLGADSVIDYTSQNVVGVAKQLVPQGFDVVFDTVGGEALADAAQLLAPEGNLVSIVDTPEKGKFHFVYPSGEHLKEIASWFESGKLRVPEIQVRPIGEAAAAQKENAQRHVRGKVVLKVAF